MSPCFLSYLRQAIIDHKNIQITLCNDNISPEFGSESDISLLGPVFLSEHGIFDCSAEGTFHIFRNAEQKKLKTYLKDTGGKLDTLLYNWRAAFIYVYNVKDPSLTVHLIRFNDQLNRIFNSV